VETIRGHSTGVGDILFLAIRPFFPDLLAFVRLIREVVSGPWQLAVLLPAKPSSQPCPWRRVEMRRFLTLKEPLGQGPRPSSPSRAAPGRGQKGLAVAVLAGPRPREGGPGGRVRGGLAYVLLSPVLSAAQGPLAFRGGSPLGGAVLVPQTVIGRREVEDEH
jgi:hypothetical protein